MLEKQDADKLQVVHLVVHIRENMVLAKDKIDRIQLMSSLVPMSKTESACVCLAHGEQVKILACVEDEFY